MATLLFKLRHVPDDEAEEVRALLEENGIETYETSAGSWKTSVPAIWLIDDSELSRARELLDEYQRQRYVQARQAFDDLQQKGEAKTFWGNFLENPLKVISYLALIAAILYLSVQFFYSLQ